MFPMLVRNWWAFVARGVIAVLFGALALGYTGATMLSFVFVFAIYALVGGVLTIFASISAARDGGRWGMMALEGAVTVLAGIVALAMPALTLVTFLILLGAWAALSGVLMLVAASRIDAEHGRWWLVIAGLASIVYGVLVFAAPLVAATVLTWWIGAYAIVFGISVIVFGIRLRAGARRLAAH